MKRIDTSRPSWGYRGQNHRHGFTLSKNATVFMGAKEQKPVEFDPIEFGIAGPCRELTDMDDAEKQALRDKYGCGFVGDP